VNLFGFGRVAKGGDVTIRGRGDLPELYSLLAEMTARGEEGVVATVIRTTRSVPRHMGSKMVVRRDGSVSGSVGGGAVEARVFEEAQLVLNDGLCRRVVLNLDGDAGVCGGEVEVFLEPVTAVVPFWIIGAGHVGRALLEMGASLPFRFFVVDDREEFLAELKPAVTRSDSPRELVLNFQPTPRSAVIIASRHHDLDGDYLEAIFEAEAKAGQCAAYLGVVGSRTKAKHMEKRFASREVWRRRFAEVTIPVGMAIGAETPPEIALSILTEGLAVMRGADWIQSEQGQALGLYRLQHRPRERMPSP